MATVKQLEAQQAATDQKLDALMSMVANMAEGNRPTPKAAKPKAKAAKPKAKAASRNATDPVLDEMIIEIFDYIEALGGNPKVTKNSSSFFVMGDNGHYVTVGKMHNAE